ncbi:MAG: transglycosylase domain-containing protein, partial [Clostridia bacterium]|nr:transglycosylase domain-containing protein [Clostridia bacterium]
MNWGEEVLRSFALIFKIILRIFSYVLNILLTVMLVGLITGVIVGSVFAIYIKNNIDPSLDTSLLIATGTDTTTRIYYMDYETMEDRQNRSGTAVEIEEDRIYASENSLWASYSQFPEYLTQAFIAIEDHRFREHNGVDWLGTGKAAVNFFLEFEDVRGASTITQQLVKN